MAQLMVAPRVSMSFDEFCSVDGPAVALDGFVVGPPQHRGVHASFDHHGDVARRSLPATCEQVFAAIRECHPVVAPTRGQVRSGLGMFVNDCDPDVAFSVWMLQHPDRCATRGVAELCRLEGELDTCGGMVASADLMAMASLMWVVEPWSSRFAEVPLMGASEMGEVIAEIGERLDRFAAGAMGDPTGSVTGSFDLVDRFDDVWVIREHNPLGRAAAAAAGASTVVSVRAHATADARVVSVCTNDVSLDLHSCWDELNRLEGCSAADRWGGCDLVGGSPRTAGTVLGDAEIVAAIRAAR